MCQCLGDVTLQGCLFVPQTVTGLPVSSLNYLRVFSNGEIHYVGLIPESEHGKSFAITVSTTTTAR